MRGITQRIKNNINKVIIEEFLDEKVKEINLYL